MTGSINADLTCIIAHIPFERNKIFILLRSFFLGIVHNSRLPMGF